MGDNQASACHKWYTGIPIGLISDILVVRNLPSTIPALVHTSLVIIYTIIIMRTEKKQQVIWGFGLLMFIQFPDKNKNRVAHGELKYQDSANAPRLGRPCLCAFWTIKLHQSDTVWHMTWGTWSEVGAWPLPLYIMWWCTVHHGTMS